MSTKVHTISCPECSGRVQSKVCDQKILVALRHSDPECQGSALNTPEFQSKCISGLYKATSN